MSLRQRMEASPETLQEFEAAARQRYWEALELMTLGYGATGIYLMGYVAEMKLKNACFRVDGARPGDAIQPRLGPVNQWRKRYLPRIDHEHYHSLWFWGRLLREKRRVAGRPLAAGVERALLQCSRRLYRNCWINLRYRRDQAGAEEIASVYNDVTWIVDNYSVLWR